MSYGHDPIDEVNREFADKKQPPKLPSLNKYGEVKRSFDFLISTPGKLRRGVARDGDSLRGFTDYNMKLFRSDDRRWTLYLEWVDLDGEGHRIVLPHAVVHGVLQRATSVIAECRRDRAKRSVIARGQTLRPAKQRRTRTRKQKVRRFG